MTSRGRRGAAKPIRDDDRRGAPPPGGAGGSNVTKEGGSLRERTPPTGTIRNAFVRAHPFPNTTDIEERYAEFDRWLAKRDAEVAAKAWDEGFCSMRGENPYRKAVQS